MNISYLIYQAERERSAFERHEADVRAGELAAAVARFGRSLRHAVTGNNGARRESQRLATATLSCSCAIPRPQ
jgi:hypothetical protein